ncbi:hypothetical protein LINPERPRIM_LOCUS8570 [Linum perenne]
MKEYRIPNIGKHNSSFLVSYIYYFKVKVGLLLSTNIGFGSLIFICYMIQSIGNGMEGFGKKQLFIGLLHNPISIMSQLIFEEYRLLLPVVGLCGMVLQLTLYEDSHLLIFLSGFYVLPLEEKIYHLQIVDEDKL